MPDIGLKAPSEGLLRRALRPLGYLAGSEAVDEGWRPMGTGFATFPGPAGSVLIRLTGDDAGARQADLEATGYAVPPWPVQEPKAPNPPNLWLKRVRLKLNADEEVDAWHLNDMPGAHIQVFLDDYGHLHLGDMHAARPWLRGGGSNTLGRIFGWGLRLIGDLLAFDIGYPGSSDSRGLDVQQIGVRNPGAHPSATIIQAGESGPNQDNIGSAYVILYPDVTNEGTHDGERRGSAFLFGHSSGEAGGEVLVGTRRGHQDDIVHWKTARTGGIVATDEGGETTVTGGDKGRGSLNLNEIYESGERVALLSHIAALEARVAALESA